MNWAEVGQTVFNQVVAWLPRLGASLAVLVAFWIGGVLVAGVLDRLGRSRRLDPDATLLLAQSAKWGLVAFGAVSGLGTLGVNVSAMVAGLGLTGLALSLALKEVVSNAVAGVLILLSKPFQRGDRITVTTFQGRVLEINLRYTTLESDDGRIFVPNMLLLSNVMIVRSTANGRNNA